MSPRPPRLAEALLRRLCPSDRWVDVQGDFLELFQRERRNRGAWAANLRYIKEVSMYGVWRARRFIGRPPRHRPTGFSTARSAGSLFVDLAQDARHALRMFRRAPGFTATAVIILALGIGGNTTMFTLIRVLFQQPPTAVERPDDLVRLARDLGTRLTGSLGYPDYVYYRDENRAFTGVAAYSTTPLAVAVGEAGANTTQANAWFVSGNYFTVLGVRPVLGRTLQANDDTRDGPQQVAVITAGFWHRYFGGDNAVTERTIDLNGHSFSVVGVLPEAFRGLSPVVQQPDIYVPVNLRPLLEPGTDWLFERRDGVLAYWLRVVARLQPDATLETAGANLDVLNDRWTVEFASWIAATDPDTLRLAAWPMPQLDPRHAQRLSALLRLLTAVVGSVLLIAAANIAILVLSQGAARRSEVAVRAALGAGRMRIVRQLLTESLLLALSGGAMGFALAYWTGDLAGVVLPFALTVDFAPDLRVLGATLLLATGTGALCGALPAWQLSRADLSGTMRSRHGVRSPLRDMLVMGQAAVSVLLVVAAGLFLRSLQAARTEDLGYGPSGKLFLQLNIANHGYDERRGRIFLRNAVDALRSVPAVSSVTVASRKPLRTMAFGDLRLPGREGARSAGFNRVGPRYFQTLEIPVRSGREFTFQDDIGSAPVMIVNQMMAEQYWPGEDAIGQVVRYEDGVLYAVVGVVGNAQYHRVGDDMVAQFYLPTLQGRVVPETRGEGDLIFVVRTDGEVARLIQPALRTLQDMDPAVAVSGVESLDDIVTEQLAGYRVTAVLVSVFGALALALAAVGLYGVQSYVVAQRTREIGVRIALGARRRHLARHVVARGAVLTGIGTLIGVLGAIGLARLVESMVFGVPPRDPVSLAAAPLVLVSVAALASVVPAMRAARVDPVEALREE